MSDVIHEGRPRIVVALAVGTLALILLGGLAAFLLLEETATVFRVVIGAGCAAVAGVAIPWQVLDARSRKHVLTETGLVYSCGVLSRFEVEIPYANIQAVTVKQGILQRLFGCGDVRAAAHGVSGPTLVTSKDLNSITIRSIPDWREVGETLRGRMGR